MKQSIQEFLSYLSSLDINLRVDDADLCCDAPKGVLTSELRADIAKRKPEIIAFLQESDTNSIRPFPRNGDIPLSFAQERLWFLNQLEGDSAAYNEAAAINISGDLNVTALEQALVEIVRRHEVLRTSFQMKDGVPYQIISPTPNITFDVVDLQKLPETLQSDEVTSKANYFVQKPFDLSEGPLLRVSLLHIGENSYILIFVMHHIVGDGWSIEVLQRELNSIYSAYCQGKDSPLPELKIQYADFTFWQRQWLTSERLANQLSYWKEQLAGVPPLLELPTDRSRPPVQTFRGSKECFVISASLTSSLKNLSKKSGVTLYMTLLAAFSTLLYRYSGQSDIVVGSPIAGRNRSEIEGLIGFLVNTLVLRIKFEENLSFQKLIARVREVTLDAYEHQDLPFEQLVSELQPERTLSYSPLCQVMFVLQNVPIIEMELSGITWNPLSIEAVVAKFDLTLSIEETDSVLRTTWEYNTDLFDASTVQRMAGHFQTLLESIAVNPRERVSVLPLLSEAERHQILVEWNDTATEYPSDKCIHQLFSEHVSCTPDAVAVVFEESQLTYRELNDRANQLAHYLRSLGVGPEVLVGICVERSLEMVVGLLGILKAGGAYVPLDPAYPPERIAYILSDARVTVLLTQSKLLSDLTKSDGKVVCLDRDWGAIASWNEENPENQAKSSNLAYIIYTSGSTGKPKGVMVAHKGLCNLARAQMELFDIQPVSRVLQFASLSFDASIWEIVMAFCAGARLCMGTSSELRPGPDLIALLQKQAITHVTLPPSTLATMTGGNLPGLLNIIVAGEASNKELVEKWSLGRRLFNAYGPTESTICATVAECSDSKQQPTIGRPIANTQVYILDSNLQPVPIGVPGELYIGGAGLARGYLNRPELTCSKFIPHPFSNSPGARLYKTGDRARYRTDGNIEFLGRIDNQVKIRGFRIELGEIEATLAQHPAVVQAVVIAREDIPGDKRLVAYIVANREPPTVSELRDFLKSKLPGYMVPAAFVTLEAMPLTPNGKVSRRALPAPEGIRPELARTYVMPQTESEKLIAGVWQDVLKLDKVGIGDNFFDLGGNSLLIVRVQSKLLSIFERELSIVDLFTFPTIQQLAQHLSQQQDRSTDSELRGDCAARTLRDRVPMRTERQGSRKEQRQQRKKYR